MKKRIAAAALLLCLGLSACGAGPEPPVKEEAATLLETASGLAEEETLLRIDGREVPAWRYLYWLAYTCDQLAQRYTEAKLPLDWSAPVSGGTLADYAKEQALADTAIYAVVENWADAYGGEMPEAAGESDLPELGLKPEQMRQLEEVGQRYAALYALCAAGDGALSPTEEELTAYGREAGALTVDRILVSGGSDREAARQSAGELFSRLNGAEDQGAAFSELAAAGDDPAGPRTVLAEDGTLDETLRAAARALEEGQCSGILESEEGFSVLRRLPLDTAALLPAWFDASLEEAARQAQVTSTEAYSALDAAAFYEALRQARQSQTRM